MFITPFFRLSLFTIFTSCRQWDTIFYSMTITRAEVKTKALLCPRSENLKNNDFVTLRRRRRRKIMRRPKSEKREEEEEEIVKKKKKSWRRSRSISKEEEEEIARRKIRKKKSLKTLQERRETHNLFKGIFRIFFKYKNASTIFCYN